MFVKKMENLFPIPINYFVILFVEIIVFSLFVYFVFTKTTGEICRRWKASVFLAALIGVFVQASFIGLGWVGWLMEVNLSTFFQDFIQFVDRLIPASLAMASFVTLPIIILGTFFAYAWFAQHGDYLIDKYWRNPKVYYRSDQKPPFHNF
jgi:hypothetical protein